MHSDHYNSGFSKPADLLWLGVKGHILKAVEKWGLLVRGKQDTAASWLFFPFCDFHDT